jgi:hypothetical protein
VDVKVRDGEEVALGKGVRVGSGVLVEVVVDVGL